MSRQEMARKIAKLANEILEKEALLETAEQVIKAVDTIGYDYELVENKETGNMFFMISPRY